MVLLTLLGCLTGATLLQCVLPMVPPGDDFSAIHLSDSRLSIFYTSLTISSEFISWLRRGEPCLSICTEALFVFSVSLFCFM